MPSGTVKDESENGCANPISSALVKLSKEVSGTADKAMIMA